MTTVLSLVALTVVVVIATTLSLSKHYDDGVFGKLALIGMIFGSGLPLMETFVDGTEYRILPETLVFQIGCAMFMARHFYRFMRFTHG